MKIDPAISDYTFYFGEIYGIKIYCDPTLPIGSWRLEDARMMRITKSISDLRNAFRCELMDVESIHLKHPPEGRG